MLDFIILIIICLTLYYLLVPFLKIAAKIIVGIFLIIIAAKIIIFLIKRGSTTNSENSKTIHATSNYNEEKPTIADPLPDLTCRTKNDEVVPEESHVDVFESYLEDIHPDAADLLWIKGKNYIPAKAQRDEVYFESGKYAAKIVQSAYEEPSLIDLDLQIKEPLEHGSVVRPSYYPSYTELTSEQRWMYWKFLRNPYDYQNDLGYVFLFYYGLERFLYQKNSIKAFELILKLSNIYRNESFQYYSFRALISWSLKFKNNGTITSLISAMDKESKYILPGELYFICKYQLDLPITPENIMHYHKEIGLVESRYIKRYPDKFLNCLSSVIMESGYDSNALIGSNIITKSELNTIEKIKIDVFANISLKDQQLEINDILHSKLGILFLEFLEKTNEIIEKEKTQVKLLRIEKKFDNMSGLQFEKYCADVLLMNGFTDIEVTPGSGDQGIDIIARKCEKRYGIQCKFYSNPVGNSSIQEAFAGKTFYDCDIGVVLTNNAFTKSATELANKIGILLWDGKKLQELQNAYQNN